MLETILRKEVQGKNEKIGLFFFLSNLENQADIPSCVPTSLRDNLRRWEF